MRTSLLFLAVLTGCPNPPKEDDSGTTDTDTGPDVTYDPGCILVDGGGGYAHIADAVTLAQEGSTITLCDGTYEEAVTIDKAITIQGESADGVILSGPGSDVPLTVTGSGVTLENLVLESPRTGLVLDGATDLTVTAVTVASAGSWGVTATNVTGTLDGLTIVEPAAGGIQVSGGMVAITNADIQYPGAYGVEVTDDADVSVDDSVITGTLMLSADVSDGYALHLDGGTLSATNTTVAGCDGVGLWSEGGTVSFDTVTVDNAVYLGIYAVDTDVDITGSTFSDAQLNGMYIVGDTVSVDNTSITTDSAMSCDYAYADWGVKYGPWCGGALIAADTITFDANTISGWNDYGFLLQPNAEETAAVSVTGGTVDDVGRWGAYFLYTTGTVSGLEVLSTREPELEDPCGGYIDQSVGLLTTYSDLAIDSVNLANNAGWGMSSVDSTDAITASTFDGNGCAGMINYQGSATVDASTFTNGTQYGGLYDYQGVTVVTGSTFSNNRDGYSYSYDSGGSTYSYEYDSGYGQDILSASSAALVVTGNTFTGGDDSIYLSSSTGVEISDNTWTDYNGTILYAYDGDLADPPSFTGNTLDDITGPVVSTVYGGAEVEDVVVGTTRTATTTYSSYIDGVLDYTYSYESSSPAFSVSGYYYDDGTTVYDYPAELSVSNAVVDTTVSYLASASDGRLELDDVTAGTVGSYGVYGSWSSTGADLDVENLEIESTAYAAFYLYGTNPYGDYGTVSLSGVDVGTAGGDGVYARGIGAVSLEDVTFGTVSEDGLDTEARFYAYDYDSGTYLDYDAATVLDVGAFTVASASGDGIAIQGGSATLADSTVTYAAGDGVQVEGPTSVALDGVAVTSAGGNGVSSVDTYTYTSAYGDTTAIDGDTAATVTNTTVGSAGSAAFSFTGGSLTMSASTASTAGTSGLVLDGVSADVQDNTFTGGTEYGMSCVDVVLNACASNDLTGNLLGTQLDCSDSCSE